MSSDTPLRDKIAENYGKILIILGIAFVLTLALSPDGAITTGTAEITSGRAIESVSTSTQDVEIALAENTTVETVVFVYDGKQANHVHPLDGETMITMFTPWSGDYTIRAVENGTVVATAEGTK